MISITSEHVPIRCLAGVYADLREFSSKSRSNACPILLTKNASFLKFAGDTSTFASPRIACFETVCLNKSPVSLRI